MSGPEKCTDCPFLAIANEAERMAGFGIIPLEDDSAVQRRIAAIMIGRYRAEQGCSGPQYGRCRFSGDTYYTTLTTDPNVPLLRRPVEDGQDGRYL